MTPIELTQKLTQYEYVDTAIAVYKEANFIIGQYDEIKKNCLSLAENELMSTGEVHRKSIVGSCGWTEPKTKKLNEAKWRRAVNQNKELMKLEDEFERIRNSLSLAQAEFMELPEGRFFIK